MTEYSIIYDEFKDKIIDYTLLEFDTELQKAILFSYLKKSVSRFRKICKNDLDLSNKDYFTSDLTLEEIDILSEWMIVFWITPYLNNQENLRNILNTKDFSQISPANLLNAIKSAHEYSKNKAMSLMNSYSYENGEFEKLRRH